MLTGIINYLEGIIEFFGVWGVFIASFTEEVIAFLPSPVIMTASGFFLLDGPISVSFFIFLFLMIAVPYAIGVTLGSFVFYGLLYFWGESAITKWGKFFGVSWNSIEKIRGKMKNNYWDEITFMFFRIVPIIPSAALASACGLIKMKPIKYTIITLFGVSIRASIFAFLGFYFGETYRQYAEVMAEIESIVGYTFLFLVVLLLIFAFIYTQQKYKKNVL